MAKSSNSMQSSKAPKYKAGVKPASLTPKRGVPAPGQKDTGTRDHAKAAGRPNPTVRPDYKPDVSAKSLMPKRGITAPGQAQFGNAPKEPPTTR